MCRKRRTSVEKTRKNLGNRVDIVAALREVQNSNTEFPNDEKEIGKEKSVNFEEEKKLFGIWKLSTLVKST
jgi:hypothetical protein